MSVPEEKELEGLLKKGDPYDASKFRPAHAEFKLQQSRVFASLSSFPGSSTPNNVFYLDGSDCGTTLALTSSSPPFPLPSLYTANVWPSTVSAIRSVGVGNVEESGAAEALGGPFGEVEFKGFYFDGCGGGEREVVEMVDAAFGKERRLAPRFALGFTLTRAASSGLSLGDRERRVARAVSRGCRERGFKPPMHVGDDPSAYGLGDEELRKEESDTLTEWFMCEKILS